MATLNAAKDEVARAQTEAQLLQREGDATYTLLVKRVDELIGCTEGSQEEEELRTLVDAIEAYETKRWPSGKGAGGKG